MAVKFNAAEQRFALRVSQQTGLELVTVLAWIQAERGPAGNPLNIGPGRDYGTPEAAAAATVNLLRTPRYAGVVEAARGNDARAELLAIAQSPWDAGRYTAGRNVPAGTTLLGALAAIQKTGTSLGDAASAAIAAIPGVGPVLGVAGLVGVDVSNPITGAVGDAARWVEGKAATGLAYVVLTFTALALIVLGLGDVFGVGPGAVRAEVGRRRSSRALASDIPY